MIKGQDIHLYETRGRVNERTRRHKWWIVNTCLTYSPAPRGAYQLTRCESRSVRSPKRLFDCVVNAAWQLSISESDQRSASRKRKHGYFCLQSVTLPIIPHQVLRSLIILKAQNLHVVTVYFSNALEGCLVAAGLLISLQRTSNITSLLSTTTVLLLLLLTVTANYHFLLLAAMLLSALLLLLVADLVR
ncbi:hypothetical protein J6590_064979 [Homalodisca vitripennis]|nr:hypothetical protein J6590_064979 [Homalodisca vitripennis]